jgi:hypothetical protein
VGGPRATDLLDWGAAATEPRADTPRNGHAHTIAVPATVVEHGSVSPIDPPDDASSTQPAASPAEPAPSKRRNPWMWVSLLLGLAAIGLLAWALAVKSDRDSAQDELDSAQQQLTSTAEELDKAKQDLDQQQSAETPGG